MHGCGRDDERLSRLCSGNGADRLHRLYRHWRPVEEPGRDHGAAERQQDPGGVHLQHREIGNDERDKRAEVPERASPLCQVEAVARGDRGGEAAVGEGSVGVKVHRARGDAGEFSAYAGALSGPVNDDESAGTLRDFLQACPSRGLLYSLPRKPSFPWSLGENQLRGTSPIRGVAEALDGGHPPTQQWSARSWQLSPLRPSLSLGRAFVSW